MDRFIRLLSTLTGLTTLIQLYHSGLYHLPGTPDRGEVEMRIFGKRVPPIYVRVTLLRAYISGHKWSRLF